MGTWSTDSFGNDGALDWLGDLQDSSDGLAFIRETLSSGDNEGIIAAGEVLAFLKGKPGADLPEDAVSWCVGKSPPDSGLLQDFRNAIGEILEDPDADVHDTWAELGEDDEDYLAWLATLRDLQSRLG